MYSTGFLSKGHWTKIGRAALVLFVLTSVRLVCPNGRQYYVQHFPRWEGRRSGSERSLTKGDGVNGYGAQAGAKGGRPIMKRAGAPEQSVPSCQASACIRNIKSLNGRTASGVSGQ